jgi:hypothetical protein
LHLVSLVVKAIIPRQYLSVRFVLHHPLQLIGFRANGPREFGDGIEMKGGEEGACRSTPTAEEAKQAASRLPFDYLV